MRQKLSEYQSGTAKNIELSHPESPLSFMPKILNCFEVVNLICITIELILVIAYSTKNGQEISLPSLLYFRGRRMMLT